MIKEPLNCFKVEMIKIFNNIWKESKTSDSWKEYAVFFGKKGK